MAATAYPHYSLEDAKFERGVSCKGCQVRVELVRCGCEDRDQVFSTRGFLFHFSQCMEAQHLWAESEGERDLSMSQSSLATVALPAS